MSDAERRKRRALIGREFATSEIKRPYPPTVMLARSTLVRAQTLHSTRTFTSSVSRAQAVPVEKTVLNKEFKIYRWVRAEAGSIERRPDAVVIEP